MAFRKEEEALNGRQRARNYLIPRNLKAPERQRLEQMLDNIEHRYGPVVDSYPIWHPLISAGNANIRYQQIPNKNNGYSGVDHIVCFAHAFLSCQYRSVNDVISTTNTLQSRHAKITATQLNDKFYSPDCTSILVTCDWEVNLNPDHKVPTEVACELMLEHEVKMFKNVKVAVPWEEMRPFLLGSPNGSRSSLFVEQDTGLQLKKLWNPLLATGIYSIT